jgi:hypothetical protein
MLQVFPVSLLVSLEAEELGFWETLLHCSDKG